MAELDVKNTLALWAAFTNYLVNNPLVGKDDVQLALYRLETKLEQAGIYDVAMILSSEFSYTLEYECEGLRIVTELSKEKIATVDVKQILNI